VAAVFTPRDEKEYFTPFGPLMGYFKMPAAFVAEMNRRLDDALDPGNLSVKPYKDHSDHLVGKVREELLFDDGLIGLAANALGQALIEYHIRAMARGRFGAYDHTKHNYSLDIISGWFVRQFEHDYNPLHIHTGCHLSCVGYLRLPDNIEQEWVVDYQDHHPSHGHLQFAHGTDSHYTVSNFMVKPSVGDFWMFPSHMFHCVYPFNTPGERRSFSMNVSISEQSV